MLTSLVLIPALGALVVATLGRATERIAAGIAVAFAMGTLSVGGWVAFTWATAPPLPQELHSWAPVLGAAMILAADGLSLMLGVWIALASALTLGLTRPDGRTAALILTLEAATLALFLSRDVFLLLASVGAIAVTAALLSTAPRKVLVAESVAVTILMGWFVAHYRMVYAQTGFVSTELARWETLVLYPDEQRWLFLLGAVGVAWMIPALAIALESAPRPGRLALSSVFIAFAGYFTVRVLVPLAERGADSTATWVALAASLLMASTVFARGWTGLAAGYQGLVLFGLFSFQEGAVVGALLMMIAAAVGGFGLLLATGPRLTWVFASFLVGLPVAAVIGPLWMADPIRASWGTAAFAVMVYRLVTVVRHEAGSHAVTGGAVRGRFWFALPVLLWSVSMVIGFRTWERWLVPSARDFAIETSVPELDEGS